MTDTPENAEPRCPQCQALLYSRRARLCGQCGAPLPPELVLSDEQVRARTEERAWARDLANQFSDAGAPQATPSTPAVFDANVPGSLEALEKLVSRADCAAEFKHRKRPAFWLYVLGYVLLALPCVWFALYIHTLPAAFWLGMSAVMVLHCLSAWVVASPICPNCRQNIRLCPQEYCHGCGKPIKHDRCAECGVDNSWLGWLKTYSGGVRRFITFCPGCGVELDTWVRRWREIS